MVRFLFVRHGHTAYNEEHLLQGQRDIPLSPLGREDALKTKLALKDEKIDEIYTSPLKRAKETAEIINEDRKVPLYVADDIIEMNYGDLEGLSTRDVGLGVRRGLFFSHYPHGENYFEVALRVYPFLKKLEEKYKDEDKTILLVAHMGVYRVIRSYFVDMTNDEFATCRVENCQIIHLPMKGEKE